MLTFLSKFFTSCTLVRWWRWRSTSPRCSRELTSSAKSVVEITLVSLSSYINIVCIKCLTSNDALTWDTCQHLLHNGLFCFNSQLAMLQVKTMTIVCSIVRNIHAIFVGLNLHARKTMLSNFFLMASLLLDLHHCVRKWKSKGVLKVSKKKATNIFQKKI